MPVPMKTPWTGAIVAAAIALPAMLHAQAMLAPRLFRHVMMNNQETLAHHAPAPPPHTTYAYGADKAQNLDLYMPSAANTPVPLVLFVHGGGWTMGSKDNATGPWKAPHYTSEGYAFATMNYRLVPHAKVEDQAADVAQALRQMIHDGPRLGIDPHHIVLMGHSAGAQIVALVGTDEHYLKAAGLSFADVAGIIPIDGAAYNVPEQMKASGAYMGVRYETAFGTDPARQAALSPTLHADARGVPRFLLLHVQRPDGIAQARELASALHKAGTPVEMGSFPGTGLMGHITINQQMGAPDYAPTGVVDAWLKGVFGR